MTKPNFLPVFISTLLSLYSFSEIPAQSDKDVGKYGDWLISVGKRLLYKVRIDVFLPDGQPAKDFHFEYRIGGRKVDQKSRLDGNRLTVWLSVWNNGGFAKIFIKTKDGKLAKTLQIMGQNIRQHCSKGICLELVPARRVRINVFDHKSKLIENARIIGEGVKTNSKGLALIHVPVDEPRTRISVIAPNGEVGLLNLFDTPEQAKKGEFNIETFPLGKTKKQTIRLIDQDGDPVKHLMMSPQPMDRKINLVPDQGFPVISDKNGEAKFNWIPGLPGPRGFIGIYEPDWIVVGDKRTPELWTVHLKPLRRKLIKGKIQLPKGFKGGFGIQLTSFDHPTERRIDQIHTRTNAQGEFVAKVLPSAHYGVYVVDSQWSSSLWDGVLVEENGQINAPELQVKRGLPVKIKATKGKDKAPLANVVINLIRKQLIRTNNGVVSVGPYHPTNSSSERIS